MTKRAFELFILATTFVSAFVMSALLLFYLAFLPAWQLAIVVSLIWAAVGYGVVVIVRRSYRSRIKQMAQENKERLVYEQAVREASLDALITIDDQGTVLSFSESAQRMFDYDTEQALGANIADLIIPEHFREAHIKGMEHFNRTGDGPVLNQRIEIEAVTRSGKLFPCELTVIPIRLVNSIQFTAFVRDISTQREAQAALEQAKQQAETANVAKTRFLTTMSHEMRSPLTSVVAALDLLIPELKKPDHIRWSNTAKRSCATLLSLVNDVLDMARIETGSLDLHPTLFDPTSMLYSICEIGHIKAHNKDIVLCPIVSDPMPDQLVGDATRIRQVLINLLDNAIKFTDTGGIHLRVGYEENDSGRGKLRVEVADSGIGISAQDQEQLFDEFYQVDNSNTTPFDGTGLGLSIVKELIDRMGGTISLDSTLGQGTSIVIELPLARPPDSRLQHWRLDKSLLLVAEPNLASEALCEQCRQLGINVNLCPPQQLDDQVIQSVDCVLLDEDVQWQSHVPVDNLQRISFSKSNNETTLLTYPLTIQDIYSLLESEAPQPDLTQTLSDNSALRHARGQHRLLLAEDNDASRHLLCALLERAGYQIVAVEDGMSALDTCLNQPIDLALMDMRMPKMDGINATISLRDKGFRKPIIAMTANAMPNDIDQCLDSGMDDFITKPVRAEELNNLLDRWLQIEDREPEMPEASKGDTPRNVSEALLIDNDALQALEHDIGADALPEILDVFLAEIQETQQQIPSLGNDDTAWGDLAHKTKSSSGFYGATLLHQKASELENAVKQQEQAERIDLHRQAFTSALSQTIEAYGSMIRR